MLLKINYNKISMNRIAIIKYNYLLKKENDNNENIQWKNFFYSLQNAGTVSQRGLAVGRELQSSRKIWGSNGSRNRLCWHWSQGSHSPFRPNDERFGEFRPPRCSDRLCDDSDSTNGGHLSTCQGFQGIIREGRGGQARGCNGEIRRHFGARDHRCW